MPNKDEKSLDRGGTYGQEAELTKDPKPERRGEPRSEIRKGGEPRSEAPKGGQRREPDLSDAARKSELEHPVD